MNKPEFGGMFFDEAQEQGAVMYWGARGAIRNRRLEIYPDRQGFTADCDERKQEFLHWLNNDLIPFLERQVEARKTEHIVASNRDGHFRCVAEDRNSGGYLYIGAWCK